MSSQHDVIGVVIFREKKLRQMLFGHLPELE
jgi:hypothetical protein